MVANIGPGATTVFKPEECVSLAQAIHMYSDWAAYTNRAEKWVGRLEPGMAADFVVVPRGTVVVCYCPPSAR